MATSIELYEALKDTLGPKSARMLVDAIPPTNEVATRADLALLSRDLRAEMGDLRAEMGDLRAEMGELRTEMRVGFEQLRGEIRGVEGGIKGTEARLMRWMLTFFVPLWLGQTGIVVTLLVKS